MILKSETNYWGIADTVHPFHFSREIHQTIYTAVQGLAVAGTRPTLSLIQSRIGPEYDDGASTMTLMTSLMRDVDEVEEFSREVQDLISMWQRRRTIEVCNMFLAEANKADVDTSYMLFDMENSVKDISVNSQAEPLKSLGSIVKKVMTRSTRTKSTGVTSGFDTGLPSLDEILGRIHPGDFGVIGAKQGDAKTVLAVQIALRASMYQPGILFELEMQDEDVGRRVLAGQTSLSVSDIEEGAYNFDQAEELKAAEAMLENSNMFIDDRPKLRIDQIRDRCIALKRTKGINVAIVDHLRLVKALGKFQNKFDRIEFITGEMKAIAKELGMAFIVLSQVTRASQRRDDPAPQLNDFDGGSSIEQDADWCLGLFRRDRWLKMNKPLNMETKEGSDWAQQYTESKDKIEIRCLKRRRGGDGETRIFNFEGRRGTITELER